MIPAISTDCNYKDQSVPGLFPQNSIYNNNSDMISYKRSDRVDISGNAMNLFLRSCDSRDCNVIWQKQDTEFKFNYSENSSLKISGNGAAYNNKIDLDVSAEFTFQSGKTGKNGSARFYKAALSFHLSVQKNLSVNPFEKKEDILSLVRRVVNTVVKVVLDKDKDLAGIIFDPDDFKELAALDHGAFLKKFQAIIQSIIISSKVLHVIKGEKQGEQILITPKRNKSAGVKIDFSEAIVKDISFKIEDISIENTAYKRPPADKQVKNENNGV